MIRILDERCKGPLDLMAYITPSLPVIVKAQSQGNEIEPTAVAGVYGKE